MIGISYPFLSRSNNGEGPLPDSGDVERVTEDGSIRITEDGIARVLEPPSSDFVWSSVGGLKCAYRASLGVTDAGGGACSGWADQSGNARHFVDSTGTARPTIITSDAGFNSRACLELDGVDDYLTMLPFTPVSQPTTWYCVCRIASLAASEYVWDAAFLSAPSERQALLLGPGNACEFYAGGVWIPGPAPNAGQTLVIAATYNGASSQAFESNLNPFATGDTNTFPTSGIMLGARFQLDGGSFMPIKIAELILYSGAHDYATRATVMNALGAMYGVAITP